MFLSFEAVAVSNAVKTIADCDPPANATGVLLQAAPTAAINYTMDDTTNPTAAGMVLRTTTKPEEFLIEDFLKIKFIGFAGGSTKLLIHYFAGRDI
jgi:hypothetical protein